MDEEQRREVLVRLVELEEYVLRGGDLLLSEPEPRGHKGRDHSASRPITFRVMDVARFDNLAWSMMRERMKKAPPK